MATTKEYFEFVNEQTAGIEGVGFLKMMGEYVVYYHGKVIGGIYDNSLLVKEADGVKSIMPDYEYRIPYEGAKKMLLVTNLDDKEFLETLFEILYKELPEKKIKKK